MVLVKESDLSDLSDLSGLGGIQIGEFDVLAPGGLLASVEFAKVKHRR